VRDELDPAPLPEGLGIPAEDWYQTPVSVRLVMRTLLKRLETLEARGHQNSSNSRRPPSTDAPSTKRQRRIPATERRKPGGKPGHPGHPQVRFPTAPLALFPEGCSCGHWKFVELTPYHTHQVIELPVMRPDVTHWLLHQGQCLSCGKLCKATIPTDQISGYGPRLTSFVGVSWWASLTDRKYKATFSPPPLPPASAGCRGALAALVALPARSSGLPQRLAAKHSAA
jgi:transposase